MFRRWFGYKPAEDGADWQLEVIDNGIGIEPEYADKVFVIFQRLHARDSYPGTGIGLALAKKIVEFHGGRIGSCSTAGPGTTIRFTLPGPTEEYMIMTDDQPRVINVLLVEDDPGDVLMTREAFDEYLHNRLDVVTDGAEALSYLRCEDPYADAPRPDLILLDLNLPAPRRARGAARGQGRPRPAAHPGDRADHLAGRGGRAAQLPAARQRLRDQAGRLRGLHRGDQADRPLLRVRRAAPPRTADDPDTP